MPFLNKDTKKLIADFATRAHEIHNSYKGANSEAAKVEAPVKEKSGLMKLLDRSAKKELVNNVLADQISRVEGIAKHALEKEKIDLNIIGLHNPGLLKEFVEAFQPDSSVDNKALNEGQRKQAQNNVMRRCVAYSDFVTEGQTIDKKCLENAAFKIALHKFVKYSMSDEINDRNKVNEAFAVAKDFNKEGLNKFVDEFNHAVAQYKEIDPKKLTTANLVLSNPSIEAKEREPHLKVQNLDKANKNMSEVLLKKYNPQLRVENVIDFAAREVGMSK